MDSITSKTIPNPPGAYATAAEVRALTGLKESSDIDNDDLNEIILTATLQMIDDVTVKVHGAVVTQDEDGIIHLPTGLIADVNADAQVTADDVDVHFISEDGTETDDPGVIEIVNAKLGIISAEFDVPDGYTAVVDYSRYHRTLPLERAKRAVRFLAGHLAIQRMKGPGKITRADLTGIGRTDDEAVERFVTKHRTKFLDMYYREIGAITGISIL